MQCCGVKEGGYLSAQRSGRAVCGKRKICLKNSRSAWACGVVAVGHGAAEGASGYVVCPCWGEWGWGQNRDMQPLGSMVPPGMAPATAASVIVA